MGAVSVIVESELRDAVGLGGDELTTIEAVFPLISSGRASMPPVLRLDVPDANGEVDIKTAWLPAHPGIAVKVSAGFFDNPSKGLASLGGLMVVLDAETGIPRALLLDNGYLTDLRTGLAGAVAARWLAPVDARSVAVLGAGTQARYQLRALRLVRDIDSATIWARHPERARAMAAEFADEIETAVADTVAGALDGADIAVTTTPSTVPLITASMVRPGLHITAVGSDAEHKQELSGDVAAHADVFCVDSRSQAERLGELRSAIATGFDPTEVVELGDVVSGAMPGRVDDDQVTVCDLTGTGAQDTAIAGLAVERAAARGLGTTLET
jgi:ectoine utilization protein EutC